MPSQGSVSRLIDGLAVRDEAAVEQLWRRYFPRLVGLARKRLRRAPRRLEDEEDVALSAFASFCRAAEAGRFPQLLDREGLWRLLVVITVRKVGHHVRDEGRRPVVLHGVFGIGDGSHVDVQRRLRRFGGSRRRRT